MNYRHYITIGSSKTEVFPLNFLESSLVDELETGQIFYRRKFAGSLTFTNNNGADDFDLFYTVEQVDPCGKLIYEIERAGVAYWNGYFSTTDGKFDLDNCTFEVTPQPDDIYTDILDLADIQRNILQITTVVTVGAIQYPYSVSYTRNRWLNDVIEYLGNDGSYGIVPGCTVVSEFFTDTPNNYVTQATNHLLYLTIAQKSDIIRPTSSDPAVSAMMSWNELMDILWGMFQVLWEYDPVANEIHVEHISWFSHAAGMDLRTQLISRATNKYKYLKEKMPKYESFVFAEADEYNFVGVPIRYESKCVNPDPESNSVETRINVTTDLEYIIENSNSVSNAIADDGFVILCNYKDGANYYVEIETGELFPSSRLNMHLSVANLQHRYFRHNRVLIEGFMNNSLETFWTARKTKHQECYAVVCPSDNYDPADEITTELGETWFGGVKAIVQRSELKPSGEMKFDLLYGPEDNAPTPITDMKGIHVVEVGDSLNTRCTYYFAFTHPADAALVADPPRLALICQDAGANECNTGYQSLVINVGDRTGSLVINWCVPAGAPVCVIQRVDDELEGAWDYAELIYDDIISC